MQFLMSTIIMTIPLLLPLSAIEPMEKQREVLTTRLILCENEKEQKPYRIRHEGKEFVVYPNVFSPKYFPESFWFAKNVHIQPGDTFLEIGNGTGLISVMAALKGAKQVTTVDINPNAVKNTAENAFLHGVAKKFRILEGDVFDPIATGQTFDVIFFFAPFLHVDKDRDSLTNLERAVFDPNYHTLRKYLQEAKQFLKLEGKLLLGFSSTHGEMSVLEELAKENGWTLHVVEKEEQQIPAFPGVDQVDTCQIMLCELNKR